MYNVKKLDIGVEDAMIFELEHHNIQYDGKGASRDVLVGLTVWGHDFFYVEEKGELLFGVRLADLKQMIADLEAAKSAALN